MFMFTLFFLGIAFCIFAGLTCLIIAKSLKGVRDQHLTSEDKIAWSEIKAAMKDLYSRYEKQESMKQKALRSWAGTLAICAGICMIGVVLEAKYRESITMRSVVAGLVGEQRVAAIMPVHHARPVHHKIKQTTPDKTKQDAKSKAQPVQKTMKQ